MMNNARRSLILKLERAFGRVERLHPSVAFSRNLARMIDMRRLIIVLTAVASVLVNGWAEAGDVEDPGLGFIKHKRKGNLNGPDYYVVRQGESGKCFIIPGDRSDTPVGIVGGAPYASREYAETALKSSPECKGGLADE
jgi:hypothetical protein